MNNLEKEVIEILKAETTGLSSEEVKDYLDKLDCKAGSVSALIYYKDTEAFTNRNYDDIVRVLVEEGVKEISSLNDMAWMAFEFVAMRVGYDLVDDLKVAEDVVREYKSDLRHYEEILAYAEGSEVENIKELEDCYEECKGYLKDAKEELAELQGVKYE